MNLPGTVAARPFLADLSCKAPLGGSVAVNPGGMMSPPFMVRYNKVRPPQQQPMHAAARCSSKDVSL